jgi:hypothetical protein
VKLGATCDCTVRNDGYGLIPGVFDVDEVKSVLAELVGANLPRSRAGVRHAMKNVTVARVARDERMMRIAQAILGERTIPFRATLFEKLPTSNWLVAWHQDTALPLTERKDCSGWGPWSLKDGVIYAACTCCCL